MPVSAENIEKAKAFYPTAQRLDIAALLTRDDAVEFLESRFGALFHPGFETIDPAGAVTVSQRGIRGFVEAWREWLSSWESWSVVAEDFIEAGNQVLVLLDIVARSRTDRVEMAQRAANVLTFRDGRMTRVELHLDRERAWQAIGLDPQTGN